MKKNNLLKVAFLLFSLTAIFSCGDTDDNYKSYDGSSFINFNESQKSVFVVNGTDNDVEVQYNSMAPVSGSHTVTLVFDQANSTAILNQDIEIVSSSDQITDGETSGVFVVRYLGSSTAANTVAKFTLQSSTLPNAVYNSTISLESTLTCPVADTKFVGNYLIQELTPYVDGPTLSDGTVVQLSAIAGSVAGRKFQTKNYPNYCSPFMTFNFDLICGSVVVRPSQSSTCACTSAGLFFGPATTASTYNVNDDSYFELTFTNDVTGDCGSAVQTTYSFTKQ